MEKIKAFLIKANVSLLAFTAFAVRLIAFGTNISDAVALLVFASLYGYEKWLKTKDFKPLDQVFIEETKKDLSDLKSNVSAIRIGTAAWSNQGRKINNGT